VDGDHCRRLVLDCVSRLALRLQARSFKPVPRIGFLAIAQDSASRSKQEEEQQQQSGDGFAPRFDGLRFIETLITAHR
ncbi:hypothetical protein B296_00020200, partial [Ensete ventricosum]